VKALIEKYSFAADRLSAAGYAQFRPVANNADPQGRQLNRRVDIVIVAATIPRPLVEHQHASPNPSAYLPEHETGAQKLWSGSSTRVSKTNPADTTEQRVP
jgi:hypothetical protein